MKPGYEPSVWREFIKKHDDIETYEKSRHLVCSVCSKERDYCFCTYPVFEDKRSVK